jgi:hypothetical protein
MDAALWLRWLSCGHLVPAGASKPRCIAYVCVASAAVAQARQCTWASEDGQLGARGQAAPRRRVG